MNTLRKEIIHLIHCRHVITVVIRSEVPESTRTCAVIGQQAVHVVTIRLQLVFGSEEVAVYIV